MYRIALCDDDSITRGELCRMCGRILNDMGVEHQLVPFAAADALQAALEGGAQFDLLCLDILMPGESGMELARALRQHDDKTSILFITASTDFLLEGYGVRPIQYLLKPVDPASLARALADDLRLNHAPRTVSVTAGGKTAVLPLASILYVESRRHGCVFVLPDGEQFFWMTMAQAEALLPAEQFCRCHNSYLIHLAHVVRMDANQVELPGGIRIPISRRHAASFRSAVTRFLNNS